MSDVKAIHPTNDDVAVNITDVSTITEFSDRWENEPNEIQAEFGYDLPLHGEQYSGYMPSHAVDMTYQQYVALVRAAPTRYR